MKELLSCSMRNLLWNELITAKYFEEYSCLLMSLKLRQLTRFNVFMAVFSTSGIFSWKIWESLPIVTCGIIAVISIVKLVEQHIIPSEKQIENYNKITDFYSDLFIKLQRLWYESEKGVIQEQQAFLKLQELQQSQRSINTLINQIHKKPIITISRKAKINSDIYLKNVYRNE